MQEFVIVMSLKLCGLMAAPVSVPVGYYTIDEVANKLSIPGMTVKVAPDLKERAFLMNLDNVPRCEVFDSIHYSSGLTIQPSPNGQFVTIVKDPKIELRSQALRNAYLKHLIDSANRNLNKMKDGLAAPKSQLSLEEYSQQAEEQFKQYFGEEPNEAMMARLTVPQLDDICDKFESMFYKMMAMMPGQDQSTARMAMTNLNLSQSTLSLVTDDIWKRRYVRDFKAFALVYGNSPDIQKFQNFRTTQSVASQWLLKDIGGLPSLLSETKFLTPTGSSDGSIGGIGMPFEMGDFADQLVMIKSTPMAISYSGLPGSKHWHPRLGEAGLARYAGYQRDNKAHPPTKTQTDFIRSMKSANDTSLYSAARTVIGNEPCNVVVEMALDSGASSLMNFGPGGSNKGELGKFSEVVPRYVGKVVTFEDMFDFARREDRFPMATYVRVFLKGGKHRSDGDETSLKDIERFSEAVKWLPPVERSFMNEYNSPSPAELADGRIIYTLLKDKWATIQKAYETQPKGEAHFLVRDLPPSQVNTALQMIIEAHPDNPLVEYRNLGDLFAAEYVQIQWAGEKDSSRFLTIKFVTREGLNRSASQAAAVLAADAVGDAVKAVRTPQEALDSVTEMPQSGIDEILPEFNIGLNERDGRGDTASPGAPVPPPPPPAKSGGGGGGGKPAKR